MTERRPFGAGSTGHERASEGTRAGEGIEGQDLSGREAATEVVRPIPWWRRKRILLPVALLVVLVIFGVVFGAVYGTKSSDKKTSPSSSKQFAFENNQEQEGQPRTRTESPESSPTSSLPATPTTIAKSCKCGSPPPLVTEAVYLSDPVPRSISLARGRNLGNFLLWDLQPDGSLWGRYFTDGTGEQWFRYDNSSSDSQYVSGKFLVAPVTEPFGDSTLVAFSIDAVTGAVLYMMLSGGDSSDAAPNDNGVKPQWNAIPMPCCGRDGPWPFVTRPSTVMREPGVLDIFVTDDIGRVLTTTYKDEKWGDWIELAGKRTTRYEVVAKATHPDYMTVFMTVFHSAGDVQPAPGPVKYLSWTKENGWGGEWIDLNEYSEKEKVKTAGAPRVVAWPSPVYAENTIFDIVVAVPESGMRHFVIDDQGASGWKWLLASHEGYEFTDTQAVAQGVYGPTSYAAAHLISRGTWDCIGYNSFNGTDWGSWQPAWCLGGSAIDYPTQRLPVWALGGFEYGTGQVLARDLDGRILLWEFREEEGKGVEVDWQKEGTWKDLGHGGEGIQ